PGAERLEKLARAIEELDAKVKAAKEGSAKTKLATQLAGLQKDEQKEAAAVEPEALARITELRGRIAALQQRKAVPPRALATQDGGVPGSNREKIADAPVLLRGDFRREGNIVPRRFPVILAGEQQPPIIQGSGRLELARWVASPENPLTARVMANRVWQ